MRLLTLSVMAGKANIKMLRANTPYFTSMLFNSSFTLTFQLEFASSYANVFRLSFKFLTWRFRTPH